MYIWPPWTSLDLFSAKKESGAKKYARCGYTNVTCFELAKNGPATSNYFFESVAAFPLGAFIYPPSCLTKFKRVPLLGSPIS